MVTLVKFDQIKSENSSVYGGFGLLIAHIHTYVPASSCVSNTLGFFFFFFKLTVNQKVSM